MAAGGNRGAAQALVPGSAGTALPLGLLFLALVSEGYDLQTANAAAPSIVAAFGITRAAIGPLLSASLLGVLAGAALIGPLGDRWGRKRLIIAGCVLYGGLSLLAAGVGGLGQLIGLRFLIGVGLGGVLPNALALASEIVAAGRQATAAALIGIGITLGGVIAGLSAAWLLPAHGWRALFVLGGILPLAIALLLAVLLREPVRPGPSRAHPNATEAGGVGRLAPLFRAGMGPRTIAIWLVFMAVLMSVYLLTGWIPLLLTQSGFSPRNAALMLAAYQAGGVGGGIVASLLLHRRGWPVVAAFAGLACLSLALLVWGAAGLLVAGIVAAGFFIVGTQNAINGAASVSYPPQHRASGLGWALGMGRLGSIAGPLVGSAAALLGMHQARQLFLLPLVPLGVAVLAALWLRSGDRNQPA